MRHRKAGRRLNRTASHRKAMFKNMANALIKHEQIITTLPKAKDLRRVVERLITLGKKDSLHARRQAFAQLRDEELLEAVAAPGDVIDAVTEMRPKARECHGRQGSRLHRDEVTQCPVDKRPAGRSSSTCHERIVTVARLVSQQGFTPLDRLRVLPGCSKAGRG